MDRRALLIEASNIKGHAKLPGAVADVETYRSFLNSNFGGAWEDSEINVLSHPSKESLKRQLQVSKLYDFSFVTFSGHGHHVIGKNLDETRLCINDTEEISVNELNAGSPYSFVVADACRGVTYVDAETNKRAIFAALSEAEARLHPNREACRKLFYATLGMAEQGSIVFYSCDKNESASDVPSFSGVLVEVGESWAQLKRPGVLVSNEAFQLAAKAMTKKKPQQHPQEDAGRRLRHFPWSVLAY